MVRLGEKWEFLARMYASRPSEPTGDAKSAHKDVVAGEHNVYREALDQVAIVGITDVRGIIVDVNEPFCRISGYERGELIGATHALLNSGHHPRSFFDQLWKTISTGRVWRSDICNRSKCGRFYWVDTTIAPWRDEIGRLQGYVSIRFDVTDRKAAEERALIETLRRQDSETLLAGFAASIKVDDTCNSTETR